MSSKESDVVKFKEIMGNYPTGVTVITANNQVGQPVGMTVNSFSSVSLEPLMVLWSIRKDATEFEAFITATHFVVNVLDGSNIDACKTFATRDYSDRFSKVAWHVTKNGNPVLDQVCGVMECETVQQIEAGDHIIIVGQVIDLEKQTDTPMLYYKREMGHIPSNWVKLNT